MGLGPRKKIEKGIWWLYKKKTHYVAYSKRNPSDNNRQVQRGRYGFRTLTEARKARLDLIKEVEEQIKQFRDPKWGELVKEVIQDMEDEGLGKNTIYNYRTCLEGNTLPCWGRKRVSEITTGAIKQFFRENRSKWSESHTKNMVKMIKKVLEHAREQDYINRNPMPNIRTKANFKLKTVLKESHIKAFLKMARQLNDPWYPIWATAIYTGMRNGELYALRWDNVSIEQKLIKVCEAWDNKNGFKDTTKSGDDRIVEIASPLLVIFQELRLANPNSEFVLPRMTKWDKGEQARELRTFLIGMGLPPIRFHDLRASWATLMLTKGIEPIKVMKMGGWKELKTMERYVRQAGVDIKGITTCLDDIHDPRFTGGEVVGINSFQKIAENIL